MRKIIELFKSSAKRFSRYQYNKFEKSDYFRKLVVFRSDFSLKSLAGFFMAMPYLMIPVFAIFNFFVIWDLFKNSFCLNMSGELVCNGWLIVLIIIFLNSFMLAALWVMLHFYYFGKLIIKNKTGPLKKNDIIKIAAAFATLLVAVIALNIILITQTNPNDKIKQPANDKEAVEMVYKKYLQAGKECDIKAVESLVTKKSNDIANFTCSNLADEIKCYEGREYRIRVQADSAVVYLAPFGHNIENPMFFTRENGQWKLDLYKMSQGLTMVGSGCDSGWNWRSRELKEHFCSFFRPGHCPEDNY